MRFLIRFMTRGRRMASCFPRAAAFTLVELLTVMAVIAILAALILSISGYATKKGALARAQGEIQALSAACESYKADNGTYPCQPLATAGVTGTVSGVFPNDNIPSDRLFPTSPGAAGNGNSAPPASGPPAIGTYAAASLELYQCLSGDLTGSGTGGATRNYIADLKQDALGRATPTSPVSPSNQVFYLSDPFGNSYGYSTAQATAVQNGTTGYGYNPTFDLWSTGGSVINPNPPTTSGQPGDSMLQWVRNW